MNDNFNTRVLKALAPTGITIEIYTVEEGVKTLQEEGKSKERVMVLTKTPVAFDTMTNNGVTLKEVNLGGMGRTKSN